MLRWNSKELNLEKHCILNMEKASVHSSNKNMDYMHTAITDLQVCWVMVVGSLSPFSVTVTTVMS